MNTVAMIVLGILAIYLIWAIFLSGPKTFPSSYIFPAIVTILTLGGTYAMVGFN